MKRKKKTEIFQANFKGLQIAEKTYNGITIGFIVGWWKRRNRWNSDGPLLFRNFREGVIFKTRTAAIEYRDSVEEMRGLESPGLVYEPCE